MVILRKNLGKPQFPGAMRGGGVSPSSVIAARCLCPTTEYKVFVSRSRCSMRGGIAGSAAQATAQCMAALGDLRSGEDSLPEQCPATEAISNAPSCGMADAFPLPIATDETSMASAITSDESIFITRDGRWGLLGDGAVGDNDSNPFSTPSCTLT